MSDDVRFAREIDAAPEKVFDTFKQPDGQEAFYGEAEPGWIYRHEHLFRVTERPQRLLAFAPSSRRSRNEERRPVSATVLYMSMSLDGFVAGPNEDPDRLHEWYFAADADRTAVNGQVIDEFMATGAVVAGRGTFEPAGGWGGDHHDGVPIWVLSRREPGIDVSHWPLVTYVNDVTSAMTQAKDAAGDKNVLVHGAATAQLALAAGVLDELELHVIPVLFGQGRRLFEGLAAEQIALQRTRILEGEGGVTHMHYRVQR